jgi:hypothetical protein
VASTKRREGSVPSYQDGDEQQEELGFKVVKCITKNVARSINGQTLMILCEVLIYPSRLFSKVKLLVKILKLG